jgi:2',3'-cyclic-nucleotide 2'-phosphodiesterase (5'-nucleotidase family)
MILNRKTTLLLSLTLLTSSAHAKVIQILHTNDLHAAMKTSGAVRTNESEFGGWAQIKTIMDRLTAAAKIQGVETVRLDAGDFYEGTSLYFPDHGKSVLKAFQHMGYDAAALGNHDWLMGADNLDRAFGEMPFSFPILSANLKIKSSLPNLKKQIIPSTQIVRDGIKIGVFGLSTDEALYSWIPRIDSYKNDMKILDFRDDDSDAVYGVQPGIATEMMAKLHRENDLVIALTHIGYDEDQILAENSRGLDLIIGGHSHTILESMNQTANRDGINVPIVQTGFNGKYIGKILVDVTPGKKPEVLTYELVPVPNDTPQDPTIAAVVTEAKQKVDDLYTPARLNEVIGKTEVRLISGDSGPTAYSKFVADAMKDVTGAEISLDVGAFHGNTPQAAGDVTRLKLMEMYPRKFEVEQNEGLYIYEARVPGWVLSLGLKYAVKFGMFLSFSGLTFDVYPLSDAEFAKEQKSFEGSIKQFTVTPYRIKNIKVNGQPIRALHSYTVAMPESLIRGAWGITPLTKLILKGGHPTNHTLWDAMNHYLYKIKTIKRIRPDEHFTAREFSNRYQKRHRAEWNHEQYDADEAIDAPWAHEYGSLSALLTDFINDVQKHLLLPTQLLEREQPSDPLPTDPAEPQAAPINPDHIQ